MMGRFFFITALLVALVAGGAGPRPALAEVGSLAWVQPDGALKVGVKTIRLHGIHIPITRRTCRVFLRPVRCGPQAILDLDFKIHGFVFCTTVGRNSDGTTSAVCRVNSNDPTFGPREDLAGYLLRQGWAVALPNAPIDYITWERIARRQGRGIWGAHAHRIDLQ